jgi:predicted nicotinamide N-methyase
MMDAFVETTDRYHAAGAKRLAYLSMEFLVGRSLTNNLRNMGLFDAAQQLFSDLHIDLADVLEQEPDADVVLAGDLFYEKPTAERVMRFLTRAQARGAEVLVGDPGREYLPRARFEALATYEVSVPPGLEDRDTKVTSVWRPARAA